jgi:hypothetical protein
MVMPNDASAILALPYIQPSQAQKHVSHNEALRKLDLLVRLVVSGRQLRDAPALPEEGERYIVPAGASGTFLGKDGRIALWEAGSWNFIDALPGWRAEVRDESRSVVFDDSSWVGP